MRFKFGIYLNWNIIIYIVFDKYNYFIYLKRNLLFYCEMGKKMKYYVVFC